MTNNDELAQLKQLATFMTERFSMNPVSCKILNEDWKKRFPDDAAVAETLVALLAERDADKEEIEKLRVSNRILASDAMCKQERIAELEAREETLRPVGVMSEKAFYRLERSESRFIALWPRPGIHLPRKRPDDGLIVYARTAAGIKVEMEEV